VTRARRSGRLATTPDAPEAAPAPPLPGIAKCSSGIHGFDEITFGGLPRGRSTLICGGAGTGKTLFAMEFIVRGARDFREPGLFVTFEESAAELVTNVASLGIDLAQLIERKRLAIDHIQLSPSEIMATGEFNLDGLFIHLGAAIKAVGAKRIAIDSLGTLLARLPNELILGGELRRLFAWLKELGITAIITTELGDTTLTRYRLDEYISDCVIVLDQRVINQMSTRRLRIIKYRGALHGTNEYPMLIDEGGLSVLPIRALNLDYPLTGQHQRTGIPRLDTMLGGKGFYRGSCILISGSAGSGKTSLAALFALQLAREGKRCLYLPTEEAPRQLLRNLTSIGVDLAVPLRQGLLKMQPIRPTIFGLEQHLLNIQREVEHFRPAAVIIDPTSSLTSIGDPLAIEGMLIRLINFLKMKGITLLLTSLTAGGPLEEASMAAISSQVDTWIVQKMVQTPSERNRVLYIMKSRGMAHSNQLREYTLSARGVDLLDVYDSGGEEATGTGRLRQQAHAEAEEKVRSLAAEQGLRARAQTRRNLQAQIAELETQLSETKLDRQREQRRVQSQAATLRTDQTRLARARKED
jgi:circadian clock protein KaiC